MAVSAAHRRLEGASGLLQACFLRRRRRLMRPLALHPNDLAPLSPACSALQTHPCIPLCPLLH
ncbi:MAG: hypothetical protein AAF355_10120, partial [Myxococcota bacterium]